MVIEVNERLVVGEVAGVNLNFENVGKTKSRSLVGYHLGELRLQKEDWIKIKAESTKKITLIFDYYTPKGKYQNSVNFRIEM